MNAYEQGFIEKCAEYGVDGAALLKQAARGEMLGKLLSRMPAPEAHKVRATLASFPRQDFLTAADRMRLKGIASGIQGAQWAPARKTIKFVRLTDQHPKLLNAIDKSTASIGKRLGLYPEELGIKTEGASLGRDTKPSFSLPYSQPKFVPTYNRGKRFIVD